MPNKIVCPDGTVATVPEFKLDQRNEPVPMTLLEKIAWLLELSDGYKNN